MTSEVNILIYEDVGEIDAKLMKDQKNSQGQF